MMNVYMICSASVIMFFMNGRMVRRCELWDGVFSSPFIKDALVYPTLKGALKLLSLKFGKVEQL